MILGYTRSVLKDAAMYNAHARNLNGSSANPNAPATADTDDIRLAIAARTNYLFKMTPPRELLLELAQERNSKPLPPVIPKWGLNLPPEKYCLTARDNESLDEELREEEEENREGANKRTKTG